MGRVNKGMGGKSNVATFFRNFILLVILFVFFFFFIENHGHFDKSFGQESLQFRSV